MSNAGRPTKKKCIICGFNRIVDRCHIIPRSVIIGIGKLDKLSSFKPNKNIIILCKNHHYLLDHCSLNKEEMLVLMPYIKNLRKELDLVLNGEVISRSKRKRAIGTAERRERIAELWRKRVANFFGWYENK